MDSSRRATGELACDFVGENGIQHLSLLFLLVKAHGLVLFSLREHMRAGGKKDLELSWCVIGIPPNLPNAVGLGNRKILSSLVRTNVLGAKICYYSLADVLPIPHGSCFVSIRRVLEHNQRSTSRSSP